MRVFSLRTKKLGHDSWATILTFNNINSHSWNQYCVVVHYLIMTHEWCINFDVRYELTCFWQQKWSKNKNTFLLHKRLKITKYLILLKFWIITKHFGIIQINYKVMQSLNLCNKILRKIHSMIFIYQMYCDESFIFLEC